MVLLDRYLDQVKHLPPAPTVAVQLLALFSDPDRDIDRIVELIKHDPALTAETLRRCNRGAFGGMIPAGDMQEAVSRLGLYEIFSVVVALMASRIMTEVRAKYNWDTSRLWQHTVTTAVISANLAKRVQVVEASAFTAGLLHDIGKLILVSMEGAVYAEMLRTDGHFGPALVAYEKTHLGFTHAALGARLLARWGLPESVCTAVRLHHQSPTAVAQHQRLAAVVNFANCLAHQLNDGASAPAAAEVSPEAMALVDLTVEEIPDLLEQINHELARMQELLNLRD